MPGSSLITFQYQHKIYQIPAAQYNFFTKQDKDNYQLQVPITGNNQEISIALHLTGR